MAYGSTRKQHCPVARADQTPCTCQPVECKLQLWFCRFAPRLRPWRMISNKAVLGPKVDAKNPEGKVLPFAMLHTFRVLACCFQPGTPERSPEPCKGGPSDLETKARNLTFQAPGATGLAVFDKMTTKIIPRWPVHSQSLRQVTQTSRPYADGVDPASSHVMKGFMQDLPGHFVPRKAEDVSMWYALKLAHASL